MYSLLFSKIEKVDEEKIFECKKILNNIDSLVIFPWTFAVENDLDAVSQDFFSVGGKHYEKYLKQMSYLGIKEDKIVFVNPYTYTKDEIRICLKTSDAIFIPGGNPEMFMTLAIRLGVLDLFTNYSGIMIGESAGSVLQFSTYGVPAQNNYYNCNSFYNGFSAIKENISIDVHTQDNEEYQNNLKVLSKLKNIKLYLVYDGSCLIINRETNEKKYLGTIKVL